MEEGSSELKYIEGNKCRVYYCNGALESLDEALNSVTPHAKKRKFKDSLKQQIQRLADGHTMSKENFPKEGKLPGNSGHFNAFKRIPIRGYCWKSKKHDNAYFISHFIYKDFNRLSDSDTRKVKNNWRKIEE